MTIRSTRLKFQGQSARLQSRFLTIKPRIETHARIYFRGIRCFHEKADRIAETVALAWKWFKRMAKRGKDATQFPSVLATYAAKAVKSGRRIAGQLKTRDVMSERTQQRKGFYRTSRRSTPIHFPKPSSTTRSHLCQTRWPFAVTSLPGCSPIPSAIAASSRTWPGVSGRWTWPRSTGCREQGFRRRGVNSTTTGTVTARTLDPS
jgi:hypothetical protein